MVYANKAIAQNSGQDFENQCTQVVGEGRAMLMNESERLNRPLSWVNYEGKMEENELQQGWNFGINVTREKQGQDDKEMGWCRK